MQHSPAKALQRPPGGRIHKDQTISDQAQVSGVAPISFSDAFSNLTTNKDYISCFTLLNWTKNLSKKNKIKVKPHWSILVTRLVHIQTSLKKQTERMDLMYSTNHVCEV